MGAGATVPRRAIIARDVEPNGMTINQLNHYYGPAYADGLYS